MAEDQAAPKAEKPTYHRDRLVAEAGDFFDGTPSHVVAAALDSAPGTRVNFTREQAERAIKEFNERPVEMSYGTQTGAPDTFEEGVA